MKINEYGKKTYLIGFAFVMLLNICLTVFLIKNVFAQTSDDKTKNQPPVVAEVVNQADSPLRITISSIDNSSVSYQTINLVIQNVGDKAIRAYTLLGKSKSGGKTITTSFATKLFPPNESETNEFIEERINIKPDETLFLSIDYVEFENGNSWGEDSQQKSKQIAQERDGRRAAIKHLKSLIKNRDFSALTNLLEQKVADIQVPVANTVQTDNSQIGFRTGYKSVISVLQRHQQKGIDALVNKLNEMEKALGAEVQKQ